MNRFDDTKLAGYPANMRMVAFMNEKSNDGHNLLAEMFGDNVILWGVQHVGSNVTAGAIIYNGELLEFKAGIYQPTFLIQEVGQATVVFADLSSQTIYYDRYAECGVGAGAINLTDLSRAPTAEREWRAPDNEPATVGPWTNIDFRIDQDSRGRYYFRGRLQYIGGTVTGVVLSLGRTFDPTGAFTPYLELIKSGFVFNQDEEIYSWAIQKDAKELGFYSLKLIVGIQSLVSGDILDFRGDFFDYDNT